MLISDWSSDVCSSDLERMFSEHKFKAAVFIGGMGGIIQEYEMFRRLQPEAAVIPVISTDGATLDVGAQVESLAPDLTEDRDYVALLDRKSTRMHSSH